MSKAFGVQGGVAVVSSPRRLRRYEARHLPDPGECVDCLIVINDRGDGVPRARLALSNGASWDLLRVGDDTTPASMPAVQTVDVTPLVREAVREMLPALVPQQTSLALIPPPAAPAVQSSDDVRTLAAHMLQIVETINDLSRRLADAEERIEFLEQSALARVDVKGAA